ncbi:MAG: DUF192 domain-containing protein [Betaproteobacteria bacterium]
MTLSNTAISIAFLACASMPLSTSVARAGDLPTIRLAIKGKTVTAEVATTNETRAKGLMHRFSLKPDNGMLFVFREPQPLSFWMKNTFVALSIAYIDEGGRILNIEDMAPQTEDTHPSKGPALFALEMKKGWFRENGIEPGATVEGLKNAPPAKD